MLPDSSEFQNMIANYSFRCCSSPGLILSGALAEFRCRVQFLNFVHYFILYDLTVTSFSTLFCTFLLLYFPVSPLCENTDRQKSHLGRPFLRLLLKSHSVYLSAVLQLSGSLSFLSQLKATFQLLRPNLIASGKTS
jgi:hypothetical protein